MTFYRLSAAIPGGEMVFFNSYSDRVKMYGDMMALNMVGCHCEVKEVILCEEVSK